MVSERDNGLLPLRREYTHAWQGFDRAEVRQYLDHLEAHLRRIMSDRDAAMAQASALARELESARRESVQLAGRVEELKKPPERLEDLDERMQRTVQLAHAQAEEITTRAQAAAEKHWAESTTVSAKLRDRYAELVSALEKHADALHNEHETALESTRSEVRKVTVDAAKRRQELDTAAEHKRRTIERDFDASMAAQRAALEKHIADQAAASKAQAERRIAEATAEAKRRVDEATAEAKRRLDEATTSAAQTTTAAARKVERLAELREKARASLREADEVLKQSEAALLPLKEEAAIAAASKPVGAEPVVAEAQPKANGHKPAPQPAAG